MEDLMAQNPLELLVGTALREKNLTIALAESCTGGLVGHLLTQVPGSSDYFIGGVIAYSDKAKEEILGVRDETLKQYGAVSVETAIEMAQGARKVFQTDYAVAVTGIAGPASDLSNKPVGLTWLAVCNDNDVWTESHNWEGNRSEIKQQSAEAALNLLLQAIGETV